MHQYGVIRNRLQPEAFTLQQRVELPIWHLDGMRGLHDEPHYHTSGRAIPRYHHEIDEDEMTPPFLASSQQFLRINSA